MNRNLVLISFTVAMGGLLFGFDTAVISDTLTYLEKTFSSNEAELGWVVSSALIGFFGLDSAEAFPLLIQKTG